MIFCVFQADDDDSEPLAAFKAQVAQFLEAKFSAHLLHKVALFLNPATKSMHALTAEEQQEVLAYINSAIADLPQPAPQQQPEEAQPPSAKRRRRLIDDFNDLPPVIPEMSELHKYQALVVPLNPPPALLPWWTEHAEVFPALSAVARKVMPIMATSAASERVFSLQVSPCPLGGVTSTPPA